MNHAIEKIPAEDRARLEMDAERLVDMTDEPGQAALSHVVKEQPDFEKLESAHDRAVWTFVNRPVDFSHAEQSRFVDEHRRKKIWDGYVAFPDWVLRRDEESVAKFKSEIRKRFGSRHVHIDIFDRDRRGAGGSKEKVVQIVIYRDGLPTDDLAFVDQDQLEFRSRRPVHEASLTYDPEEGVVEVVGEDRETREDLVRCMARDLLGFDLKSNKLPFNKYNLDVLLRPHDFPTDGADGISSVKLRLVRLMPMNEQNERIVLETTAKATRTIWEMSRARFGDTDPLRGEFVCTQARLSITFQPARPGGRGKVIAVTITAPHGCSLGDHTAREQVLGEKYLERWKLLQDA